MKIQSIVYNGQNKEKVERFLGVVLIESETNELDGSLYFIQNGEKVEVKKGKSLFKYANKPVTIHG